MGRRRCPFIGTFSLQAELPITGKDWTLTGVLPGELKSTHPVVVGRPMNLIRATGPLRWPRQFHDKRKASAVSHAFRVVSAARPVTISLIHRTASRLLRHSTALTLNLSSVVIAYSVVGRICAPFC